MDLFLKSKKVVVTGGSRGLGRAIAEAFASEGADVAICARNRPTLDRAVASLLAKGVNAIGGAFDVADGSALKSWIGEAGGTLGGIDILISNAGGMANANTEEGWARNFNIDVMGAVRAVDAALPFLEQAAAQKGDASIVFIATVGAVETDHESCYGPMKAALIHFAKGLARHHAPKPIRANVVSPGSIFIEGGVWDTVQKTNPAQYENFLKRNPMGRMGRDTEIANTVVFLSSPVSSFTTGVNLVVDGGFTRRVNY